MRDAPTTILEPVPVSVARSVRAARTESVRTRLRRQRAFRVAQLAELDDLRAGASAGPRAPGRRDEVHAVLRVAAGAALRDIDAALRRLDDGTYGWCTECGGRLSRQRLDAVPSASLCQHCHLQVRRAR